MPDYLPDKFPPIQVDGVIVERVDKDVDIFRNMAIFFFTFENGLKISIEIPYELLNQLSPQVARYDYVIDCLRKDFRREMTSIANDALDNGYIPTYWKDDNINKSYPVEFKVEMEPLDGDPRIGVNNVIENFSSKVLLRDKSVTDIDETPISRFEDILEDEEK